MHGNGKLERVEQLLRAHGPTELPTLRRAVLEAVAVLPEPDLLAPPRYGTALGALGVVLLLAGVLVMALPLNGAWLSVWQLELSELSLALSVGESVLSASLLSVAACVTATLFMAVVGIYGVKHRLIGA